MNGLDAAGSGRRIIDLTMPIHEGMQTFPAYWHPFVEITQLGRHGIENRETRKMLLGSHTGTHMDAPRHFIPEGATVDAIGLDQLTGPAAVLDFSAAADRQELGPEDLARALGERSAERVILRFDWDRMLGSAAYYGDHPWLNQAACRWLVTQGCRLVAMDTPMPDNPGHGAHSEEDSPDHKILLGAGAVIVECLVNLRQIRRPVVELTVAPLKIRDADGATARCFAIERGPG